MAEIFDGDAECEMADFQPPARPPSRFFNMRQIGIVLAVSAATSVISCGGGAFVAGFSRNKFALFVSGALVSLGLLALLIFALGIVAVLVRFFLDLAGK